MVEKTDWKKTFRNVVVGGSIYLIVLGFIFVGFMIWQAASHFQYIVSESRKNEKIFPAKSQKNITDFEELWEKNGSSSYVISVNRLVLSPGPVALAVKDGIVIEVWQSACYPNCSTAEIYGRDSALYTIEALFALAKECVTSGNSRRCEMEFDLSLGYPIYVNSFPRICFTECGHGISVHEILLGESQIPADFIPLLE